MIDLDIYHTNETVEKILQSLKLNLNKEYPTIKVCISTASPYRHWLYKIYNTELMEEQHENILLSRRF